jgi:hypothetical protein
MDQNWYTAFDASQQSMKNRQLEAENYRLATQIRQQPVRWSLRLPRLNKPAVSARPLKRALS